MNEDRSWKEIDQFCFCLQLSSYSRPGGTLKSPSLSLCGGIPRGNRDEGVLFIEAPHMIDEFRI